MNISMKISIIYENALKNILYNIYEGGELMLNRLKFHYKLFISFSIFILIILLISGFIFYFYTTSIIEKNIASTQKQTSQKLQEQLDSMLNDMDQYSIAVNSSKTIMQTLKNIPPITNENYFDRYPRMDNIIKDELFSFTALQPIKGRIILISRYYDYADLNNKIDNEIVTKDYIKSIPHIKSLMNSDKYKVFLAPHQDEWSIDKGLVISINRPIRDNYQVYGLLEVSRDIAEIDQLCSFKDNLQKKYVAIFDANKKMIYDNFDKDVKIDRSQVYNAVINKTSSGDYTFGNKFTGSYISSFSRLNKVNWTVVLIENLNSLKKPIEYLKYTIIITYSIIFLIIILMIYLFTRTITVPIIKLKNAVTRVDINELEIPIVKKTTNNEITLLGQAFQNLLNEVKISTEMTLESQARELHARMLSLQSQLNPHFLYNTLSVIGAYGGKRGNIEVMDMCADLSQMLRYTVNSEENSTIEHEINHIQCYLNLMNIRFEGFFRYSINIKDNLLGVSVPKLILQPLVENCFAHAFVDVEPTWTLDIILYEDNKSWYIKITDNGKGFKQDTITKIKNSFETSKNRMDAIISTDNIQEGGVGLINTFLRLNIFFKGNEYIEFGNLPHLGAFVIIGGPKL
jgi:two-component system, sensor histidine kinase YesM